MAAPAPAPCSSADAAHAFANFLTYARHTTECEAKTRDVSADKRSGAQNKCMREPLTHFVDPQCVEHITESNIEKGTFTPEQASEILSLSFLTRSDPHAILENPASRPLLFSGLGCLKKWEA